MKAINEENPVKVGIVPTRLTPPPSPEKLKIILHYETKQILQGLGVCIYLLVILVFIKT